MSITIYGSELIGNAAYNTLKEMYHPTGYVISTSKRLQDFFVRSAVEFKRKNPDCELTVKDYDYKNPIVDLHK